MSRHLGPNLVGVALGLALAAIPSLARADAHFVIPEIGAGYGWMKTDAGGTRANVRADFLLGTEWNLNGDTTAVGWMVISGYTSTMARHDVTGPRWWRFDFSPLVTLSAGYERRSPFARVGIGPHLAISKETGDRRTGGGVQIDAAIGIKGAIELFTLASYTYDGRGATSVVGGLRVHAAVPLLLAARL